MHFILSEQKYTMVNFYRLIEDKMFDFLRLIFKYRFDEKFIVQNSFIQN